MTAFTATNDARMNCSQECRRYETTYIRVTVTHAAFSLCRDVVNLLRRCNTRVMAGRTIAAHYITIMDKSARESIKGVGIVARRTVQVRIYMPKRLADADITIMAGQAIAGICARVVKRGTSKGRGVMANVAFLIVRSGRYVIQEFAHTNPIVVARRAAAGNDTGMIKGASAKGSRGMASTAIFTGWHVGIERSA